MNWKPVEGYETLYQVSDTGLVMSMPRRGTYSKPHLMQICMDDHGYPHVGLTKNGKNHPVRIHRLVANAFLPNPHGFREINHIDEDKMNNNVNNLEWCDRAYNVNYGNRTAKTRKPVIQMSLDGVVIAEFEGVRAAAKTIGPNTAGRISNVCLGKRKSAYGYKWRYKEDDK